MYYDERNNYFDYSDVNKDYLSLDSKNYNSQDMYNEIKFDKINVNVNNFRANNLYSPAEGLNNGNMFINLYNPYKNYKYKVVVRGKREELLLRIQELTFATKDLNLYLDLYPRDTKMLETFKNYAKELKKYKEEYNRLYSPLCAIDASKDYFDWVNNPWPWENKGGSVNV